ncbi:hypothetical protein [Pseudomonas sp. P9(2020)]|uniref:hypothetical protein n=1 Tax=Pseudomonas sp. P9(2020) TaxID=2763316 RepID=UPI001B33394C|nr:hypothetical protein [Pseudomonas sp. P9(2020)]MBP5947926.1 hypothetical protein [Pseudomonas sp. P9(2020)]
MLNAQDTQQDINTTGFIVGPWNHIFSGEPSERLTRIVLNASTQKLIHMEVQANRSMLDSYRAATQHEIADVEDSLVNANGELFDAPDDFGLQAACELPAWALPALAPDQIVFYKPDPGPYGPIKVKAVGDKVDGYSAGKGMSLTFDPADLYSPAALAQELQTLIFSTGNVLYRRGKITARIGALLSAVQAAG